MAEKYGFVYIWYDRKHKRYYLGCHWGTEDDGYVCSSDWMKRAYKRRPNDFKRKILKRVYRSRADLIDEEYRFLSMINEEELGKRYYNLTNHRNGHWTTDPQKKITVGQKISAKNKANPNFGKWNCGKSLSEETKNKIAESTSIAMKEHYKENPRTPETCKKIGENSKRLQAEKKIGMHGKKHAPETIEKMKQNNAMKNSIHRNKVKEAKKGIQYLNKDGKRKMAKPNTEKWNQLIADGYKVGY
tara:strand:- start:1211 stop:1942 length:732 start_codon:yes stop_codon:yes gene_type:complete